MLEEIFRVVEDRRDNPKPTSYVSSLLAQGLDVILKKIGEEATELVMAAKDNSQQSVIYEAADLMFHMLVLLACQRIPLEAVLNELKRRRKGP
ncbi:phosphoribosyl-ATP diphosphatase [Candidatus Bathyarchaeota archaeon]|nr:phosphoribosyl-ATP diphosphatase [Candidatus Bathyarchaeota archaeon]